MKSLFFIVISFASFSILGQSNSMSIIYDLTIIDTETGESPLYGTSNERSLEVTYDDESVFLVKRFDNSNFEKRLINKTDNEVMFLTSYRNDSVAFFTNIEQMLNIDMSSNFGDTTMFITNDHKEILGFDCNKILFHFGVQTVAEMWVTKSLSCGVIFPGTPLSLEFVALEYSVKDPSLKTIYKAKSVKTVSGETKFTGVPDGYKLSVPVSKFDVSGFFPDDENDFTFIVYPKYSKGKEQLHNEIRSLCSLKPKTKSLLDETSDVYINFVVQKNGRLSDIEVIGINKKELQKVTKYLENIMFESGSVKGEKVVSKVSLSVNLNKN